MATLVELDRVGSLHKLDAELEFNEQEWRPIYVSPRMREWITDELPDLTATWNPQMSPLKQFDALLEEFCSGATLHYETQFHPIQHVGGGIWMLKTPDLRVFGWFPIRDTFVGWRGGHADYIKQHDLYHGLAGEAAHFRDGLDLDEPKFVPGEDPYAVVSNYD